MRADITVALVAAVWLSCSVADGADPRAGLASEMHTKISDPSNRVSAAAPEIENLLWEDLVAEVFEVERIQVISSERTLLEMLTQAATQLGPVLRLSTSAHDDSVTAIISTGTAHVIAHAWPRQAYVSMDISIAADNPHGARVAAEVASALGGSLFVGATLARGNPSEPAPFQALRMQPRQVEQMENVSVSVEHGRACGGDGFAVLETVKQDGVATALVHCESSGEKCITVDGILQACKSFPPAVPEVFVHLPLAFLNSGTEITVLVLGAAVLGVLDELLKYPNVAKVVVVEAHQDTQRLAEQHLGTRMHFPLDPARDPRVEWHFGNVAESLENLAAQGDTFELLLVDAPEVHARAVASVSPISDDAPTAAKGRSILDTVGDLVALLSPGGILAKNSLERLPFANDFNEYLEVAVPTTSLGDTTFVLFSNGASLMAPGFAQFGAAGPATRFWSSCPLERLDQLRAITVRYVKRGLDFAAHANLAQTQRSKRNHDSVSRDDGICPDPDSQPCAAEAKSDPDRVLHEQWRRTPCSVVPPSGSAIHINFINLGSQPLGLAWVNPQSNMPELVLPELRTNTSTTIKTFPDHKFRLLTKTGGAVASVAVESQLLSHRTVMFEPTGSSGAYNIIAARSEPVNQGNFAASS